MQSPRENEAGQQKHPSEDLFEPVVSDLQPALTSRRHLHLTFWSARTLAGQRLTAGQRGWRVGSVAVALLLVLSIITFSVPANPIARLFARRPTPPLVLKPEPHGIHCFDNATWSPDGRRVAVLGREANCPTDGSLRDELAIYDAQTGQQVTLVHPDTFVLNALRSLPLSTPLPATAEDVGSHGALFLIYRDILWSPHGQRLALPFYSVVAPNIQPMQVQGVLLMNPDGSQPRVVFRPLDDSSAVAEWDLQSGVRMPVPSDLTQPRQSSETVAPALRYQWGANGAITIQEPLGSEAARGPVGEPAGGASFTFWQPGGAQRVSYFDGTHHNVAYLFGTYFMAWSPDGRYLLDAFGLGGWIALPRAHIPDQQAQRVMNLSQQPRLPLRDAGFQSALETLPNDTQNLALAWRPDGHVVAATTTGSSISLYDCASGRHLATLQSAPIASEGAPPSVAELVMRWSPDGSHLLVAGGTAASVTLWGPAQLPR